MAEPLTWQEARRRGSWNINQRRGLYSGCHDNSNGWKQRSSISLLWRLADTQSHSSWTQTGDTEDYWHSYRCTNSSRPLYTLSEYNLPRWRNVSVSSQRMYRGVSLSVWWIVLDWSLHVFLAWWTFDFLKPSLNGRGWVKTHGGHHLPSTVQTPCIFRDIQDRSDTDSNIFGLIHHIKNWFLGNRTGFRDYVLMCALSAYGCLPLTKRCLGGLQCCGEHHHLALRLDSCRCLLT